MNEWDVLSEIWGGPGTWNTHFKPTSKAFLPTSPGCILTAQTCFPVENIHLISRHFPKTDVPFSITVSAMDICWKGAPSPKHQSICSTDLSPPITSIGEGQLGGWEIGHNTQDVLPLQERCLWCEVLFGNVCLFKSFLNVSLANMGCKLRTAKIPSYGDLPFPPENSTRNNLHATISLGLLYFFLGLVATGMRVLACPCFMLWFDR